MCTLVYTVLKDIVIMLERHSYYACMYILKFVFISTCAMDNGYC